MFNLVLEKAEESEIKLPTSTGSWKTAREFQKNIYFCFIDYAKAFDCVDHNKLWKILKEMRISDHLTCLLRNLYVGQEATVRTGHGTKDWFKIRKFTIHVLLKLSLEIFKHYFTSMWDECNCAVVWAFFGIAFLWEWNENWPFPVLWLLLSFPNFLAYWVQHFHSIIFQDLK